MKKFGKKALAATIAVAMILSTAPLTVSAAWEKDSSENWRWEEEGINAKGWKQIDGEWYLFDEEGVMQTGWNQTDDGKWYYTQVNGAMQTGWIEEHGGKAEEPTWYYANASGALQTGWIKDQGGKAEEPTWYYANASGALQTGWIKDQGGKAKDPTWYYANASGAMQTGTISVAGDTYFLASSGAMQTGWIKEASNEWYYASASGAMQTGEIKVGDKNYFLDGTGLMQTGVISVDGLVHSYDQSGAMQTGPVKINGITYTFDGNGILVSHLTPPVDKSFSTNTGGVTPMPPYIPPYVPDTSGTTPDPSYGALGRSRLDQAILAAVAPINERIKSYATLDIVPDTFIAYLAITDGTKSAREVFESRFLEEFFMFNEIYKVVITNGKDGTTDKAIDFANASNDLRASKCKEVMSAIAIAAGIQQEADNTTLSALYNHDVTVTIYGVKGVEMYSQGYTISFVKGEQIPNVPTETGKDRLNQAILAAVAPINERIKNYATLEILPDTFIANLTITDGTKSAREVFESRFLEEFFMFNEIYSVVITNGKDGTTDKTITFGMGDSDDIRASKCKEIMSAIAISAGITGIQQEADNTTISALYDHDVTVTIHGVKGMEMYSQGYTIRFVKGEQIPDVPSETGKDRLNQAILAAVAPINERIKSYATLEILPDTFIAKIAIIDGTTSAREVFLDRFLKEFFAFEEIDSVVITGGKDGTTDETVTGLKGANDDIKGSKYKQIMKAIAIAAGITDIQQEADNTTISALYGHDVTVTIHGVNDSETYSQGYTIRFVNGEQIPQANH